MGRPYRGKGKQAPPSKRKAEEPTTPLQLG